MALEKINRMRRIVLIGLAVLSVFQVNAQLLTLDEAINIALKNSLDIQIARNSLEARQVNNHISMAGGLPEVNGTASNTETLSNLTQELSNGTTTKRNGGISNSLQLGVTGSFLLFNGWRVIATKSRLAALEKQGEHLVGIQIQNVIADVMMKYYDIVRQDSYMKVIRQIIEVNEQRLRLVNARQSVGLANNADTYQAQIDLNASQQELLSQELVLVQAKSDLMNMLEQRPDSNYVIRDTILVDSTLNFAAINETLARNPELRAAEEQVRINEFVEREIGSQRYPALSLNGGFNFSRNKNAAGLTLLNQNYGPFIGLGLQVPIFNGGITRRQMRVAELDTRNASLSRQNLLNDLTTTATTSWQAYRTNLVRIRTEKENNQLAAALLSLTLQRYQLGAATFVEVREAQRSFIEAGYRLVNLSYAAKVSEIQLKRLGNQLVP
jgi:outer membrane protein